MINKTVENFKTNEEEMKTLLRITYMMTSNKLPTIASY